MKKTYKISGMHCTSCEILLEKELAKINGISCKNISHKKSSAEIEYSGELPLKKIEEAIKKCGYKLLEDDQKNISILSKNTPNDYLQIALALVVVAFVAYILSKLEVTRFFPNLDRDAGIMVAFLFGIIASLSTCLALVGGIILSFGSMYPVQEGKKHQFLYRSLPHIYFHTGRVGGFALLGGILGLIGSKVNYTLGFTGFLTILIAVVMFYMGLQILNLVPSITKFGFHLPKGLSRKIDDFKEKEHPMIPIVIGALTFFLPCGFTQSMQLAAVASQSFFTGALIMGTFALGTLPALISVGIGSTYAQKSKFNLLHKVIGAVVIFFAFYSFNSGLVLTGSNFTLDFWKNGGDPQVAEVTSSSTSEDIQVVKMDVDYAFKTREFKIKKGVPVRWEINGINVTGCSDEVVIPKLGISSGKLKQGLNIVDFTPTEEGILPFSCWMGMLNGRFIVTDDEGNVSKSTEENLKTTVSAPASSCNGSCGNPTCGTSNSTCSSSTSSCSGPSQQIQGAQSNANISEFQLAQQTYLWDDVKINNRTISPDLPPPRFS